MELKPIPIMEFATEHQKTITMVFVFILLVSGLLLPITILIDALAAIGILVFVFMVLRYRNKSQK